MYLLIFRKIGSCILFTELFGPYDGQTGGDHKSSSITATKPNFIIVILNVMSV